MATKKPTMVYQWKRDNYAIKAQVVGETVAQIAKREGACRPERLVAIAEPEDSPLHALFTWDDQAAADKWRTHQARLVINCLVVQIGSNNNPMEAPAFVSVGHTTDTMGAGDGYRPVGVVMADAGFAQEALSEALSRLRALQRRYGALQALAPVWEAVEAVAAD